MLIGLKRLLILSLLLSSFTAWGTGVKKTSRSESVAGVCTGECLKNMITSPQALLREFDKKVSQKLEPTLPPTLSYLERLARRAETEAKKCRSPSSSVIRRLGLAPESKICGNRSKGKCFEAVKWALKRAGLTDGYLKGGHAVEAHSKGYLEEEGFVNKIHRFDEFSAPKGAVLVYRDTKSKRGSGHIEIVTKKGQYCSDFCSAKPVSTRLPRKLVGVYVKQSELLTASVEKTKTEKTKEPL